ncbi:phosphate acetyltransferase [Flexivirga caeni]|uniref:Phosphate acetyltransferase n=1 Tax=Flexivirga caeni TaxID=2294115 RepID=A0A3M9M4C2_9MICO|nr:phosphate acetyltransferase [Flexivirga caeni]RNI20411.1 phosphate acetyltransferase [Flexivirga caeni]
MATNVYIASAEGFSGKSTIALGVLDAFSRAGERVGIFRPVSRSGTEPDYVLQTLLAHDTADLAYADCVGVTYDDVRDDPEAALSTIVQRYKQVEARCSAMVILGTDYTDVSAATELAYNARIAANLGAPVLLVINGRDTRTATEALGVTSARTPEQLGHVVHLAVPEILHERAELLAIAVNRADEDTLDQIRRTVRHTLADQLGLPSLPVWAVPDDAILVAPSVADVQATLGADLLRGDPTRLSRPVTALVIAGMSAVNALDHFVDGAVVIIAGDRTELLLATVLADQSGTFPSLAAIALNGGFELPGVIGRLLDGVTSTLPILQTGHDTYQTAVRVMGARGRVTADSTVRYDRAVALFERSIDRGELLQALDVSRPAVVTPLMFEYGLIERARTHHKTIVLPEGGDDRILRAAAIALSRGIADLIILGDESQVRSRALELGADIAAAQVISPFDPALVERFAAEYARIRQRKGVTLDQAADTITDVSYFGTMMVQAGIADGMVSGAAHTTAQTIRPAFEIIKTRPGVSVVSSVFLMALADRVLVYGDCAVIPDPTAQQLAEIAISSAATARAFGIEPRVAMLSYSTGSSGTGADVDKVRMATELVRAAEPSLAVDGPLQYDAATDAAVARTKLPDSQVAGRATVFIFPDLNTGNNTYKAVQRSAGAVAMGPVLQGLNKPINDLSRGALVEDIVQTIALTAIQATFGAGDA